MISIQLDSSVAQRYLQHLEQTGADLAPVMRAIAHELLAETEDNFAAEGRPKWVPLKNPLVRRQGGKILQDRGQLAASITADSGGDYAQVGSNKVYAAIHQFGGQAGRGRKVAIPARPFLPMTAAGQLQPETETAVLEIAIAHIKRAAGL
jgi:phage virion morphogenesis protein